MMTFKDLLKILMFLKENPMHIRSIGKDSSRTPFLWYINARIGDFEFTIDFNSKFDRTQISFPSGINLLVETPYPSLYSGTLLNLVPEIRKDFCRYLTSTLISLCDDNISSSINHYQSE